jgi:hypothetical protein
MKKKTFIIDVFCHLTDSADVDKAIRSTPGWTILDATQTYLTREVGLSEIVVELSYEIERDV